MLCIAFIVKKYLSVIKKFQKSSLLPVHNQYDKFDEKEIAPIAINKSIIRDRVC